MITTGLITAISLGAIACATFLNLKADVPAAVKKVNEAAKEQRRKEFEEFADAREQRQQRP